MYRETLLVFGCNLCSPLISIFVLPPRARLVQAHRSNIICPQGSRWVHQATHMKGTISRDDNWYVEPDNMQVIIPIVIFIVMPVFEHLLYPFFEKWNVLRTPKQRMFLGSLLAILAFLAGGLVEWNNEASTKILSYKV